MTNIKDDQNSLTISGVDISDVEAHGDILVGVKNEFILNITIPAPDPENIQKIITHSKQLAADSPQYLDMLENLRGQSPFRRSAELCNGSDPLDY
jgi:hypothetical protein